MASNQQVATGLRGTAQHFAEQLVRFARLTALAAIPSVVNLAQGGKFDWHTLLAFILPFAEVAYRQVWPAVSPKRVNSVFSGLQKAVTPKKRTAALTGVVRPRAGTGAAARPRKAAAKKAAAKRATPPKA